MSDNNNPTRFEQDFEVSNILNSSNVEDTYVFSLPPSQTFNGLEIAEYNFKADLSLDAELSLILGRDNDNDGIFDIGNEQIGSGERLSPNSDSISLEDILSSSPTNLDEKSSSLLQPGQDYFVNIQDIFPNDGIDNSYFIDSKTVPVLAGQINTDDPFYCCNNNEDAKYYYDELNNPSIRAGENGISVGDRVSIELSSDDFVPIIFLLNDDTGAVIDLTTTHSPSGSLNTTNLNFTVENNINYSLSIETASPGEIGDYLLEIDII